MPGKVPGHLIDGRSDILGNAGIFFGQSFDRANVFPVNNCCLPPESRVTTLGLRRLQAD